MKKTGKHKVITVNHFCHRIELEIINISNPQALKLLNEYTLDKDILVYITRQIEEKSRSGYFSAVTMIVLNEGEQESVVDIYGAWRILSDYTTWHRIHRWWYNSYTERLTLEHFQKAYGNNLGSHYFDKWNHYKRHVWDMVGYLNNEIHCGEKFLDMVMQQVILYEENIRKRKEQNSNQQQQEDEQ